MIGTGQDSLPEAELDRRGRWFLFCEDASLRCAWLPRARFRFPEPAAGRERVEEEAAGGRKVLPSFLSEPRMSRVAVLKLLCLSVVVFAPESGVVPESGVAPAPAAAAVAVVAATAAQEAAVGNTASLCDGFLLARRRAFFLLGLARVVQSNLRAWLGVAFFRICMIQNTCSTFPAQRR